MKKRRTRQHIIEDLGLNYVERQCLYAGFSVHRIFSDYGYDANVFTEIQLTKNLKYNRDDKGYL